MKKETHPKYQRVMFVDSTSGRKYFINSTLQPTETEMHEGKAYPVCHVSISSESHPYFAGGDRLVDTEGRVDKFNKRYEAMKQKAAEKAQAKPSAEKSKAKAAPKTALNTAPKAVSNIATNTAIKPATKKAANKDS